MSTDSYDILAALASDQPTEASAKFRDALDARIQAKVDEFKASVTLAPKTAVAQEPTNGVAQDS